MSVVRGCTVVLACLALARPAAASEAAPTSGNARQISEFAIDATALEREGEDIGKLVGSLDKRVRAELAQRSVELGAAEAARMRLVLRWLDYDRSDYMGKFEIQYLGKDAWTDVAKFECFACTNTALAKRVVAELPTAVDALVNGGVGEVEPPPPRTAPVASDGPPRGGEPPSGPSSKKLGPFGKSGVAILVVGGAALGVGLGLALRKTDYARNDENLQQARGVDTRPAGIGLAVTGAVAVVVAIPLLVLDRKARRRGPSLAPTVGHHALGIVLGGRF